MDARVPESSDLAMFDGIKTQDFAGHGNKWSAEPARNTKHRRMTVAERLDGETDRTGIVQIDPKGK